MAADVHVLLFLAQLFLLPLLLSAEAERELYRKDDPLSILHAGNFHKEIIGTDHAWMVEFYSSWCGHCIRFAPNWRQLAKEVKAWSPVFRLAVVDCAQEENLELCRDYNVESYPTLKWIDAYTKEGDKGVAYEGDRETVDLKHAIIDHLQNLTGSPSAPRLLPKLSPLRSLEDIWNDVTASTRFTVVFFEEGSSYTGREVILDFASRTDLVLRRMTKEHIAKFGIKSFPSLFLIKKLGTFDKIAINTNREGFVKALNSLLGIHETKLIGRDVEGGMEEEEEELSNAPLSRLAWSNYIFMVDLESALYYSLKQEVAGHNDISADKLQALKLYITVLAKYFPGRKPVMAFLSHLSRWIQVEEGPLTGDSWLQQVTKIQDEEGVLSGEVVWKSCEGSVVKYRGYPCGLWLLFHTLTVNAVLDSQNSPRFNHLEVLLSMREYISKFFGCRECSRHFMKMAVNIEQEVTSSDESILWLWRAHNKANLRLHGDLTEDPAHPKIQFPPPDLCPSCHHQQQTTDIFIEKQILIFLKKQYSAKSIIRRSRETVVRDNLILPPKEEEEENNYQRKRDFDVFASKKGQKGEKVEGGREMEDGESRIRRLRSAELASRTGSHSALVFTHWGINSLDISLCVVFYIVCCGIIILLYYHLTHNRRINFKLFCTKSLC